MVTPSTTEMTLAVARPRLPLSVEGVAEGDGVGADASDAHADATDARRARAKATRMGLGRLVGNSR